MVNDDIFAEVYRSLGRAEGRILYARMRLSMVLEMECGNLPPYAEQAIRETIKGLKIDGEDE